MEFGEINKIFFFFGFVSFNGMRFVLHLRSLTLESGEDLVMELE